MAAAGRVAATRAGVVRAKEMRVVDVKVEAPRAALANGPLLASNELAAHPELATLTWHIWDWSEIHRR
eukprot:scaffold35338_cov59-Phaeocystis_antarctica.AAC.1